MANIQKGHGETTIVGKVQLYDSDANLISPPTEATLAKLVGFALPEFDSITVTYTDGTFTETYVYKLLTVTKATITVIYTDSTKQKLVSITKT